MRKRLSRGEWAVMNALWRTGGLAMVDEVRERLGEGLNRDYRTIQTVLNRCVEKGWARLDRRERRCIYSPAISRRAGVEERAAQFLSEIAEGEESALRIARETLEREISASNDEGHDGRALHDHGLQEYDDGGLDFEYGGRLTIRRLGARRPVRSRDIGALSGRLSERAQRVRGRTVLRKRSGG